MLPGLAPSVARQQQPVSSVAFQTSSTSSNSDTIIAPAGIIAGDILVIKDLALAVSVPAAVTPSGFTNIANTTGPSSRQTVWFKIADGSEASASFTGMIGSSGGAVGGKEFLVFRPNVPANSVAVSIVNAEGTGGNPAAQNVAASAGAVPLIVIGCYGTATTVSVNPRSFSPAKDGEVTSRSASYVAYKIYNSSPADVSIDMDQEGASNILQSFYLAIS